MIPSQTSDRRLNEFTDDESSPQCVFTAQSLKRVGLSIRPLFIWMLDSLQLKGQAGQLIKPAGRREGRPSPGLHSGFYTFLNSQTILSEPNTDVFVVYLWLILLMF